MINRLCVLTFLAVLGLAALAQTQTFTTLYDFTGGADGGYPYAGMVQDQSGNMYGTAAYGGDLNCDAPNGCGVVFKLDTGRTETVVHTFSGRDGKRPLTPLVLDSNGNIYGTTFDGGSADNGTVFRIDTAGKETVLHSFTDRSDGCNPAQGLVMDKVGTVYGTTYACGSGYGTIFKIDPANHFTLIHTFAGGTSDGANPAYGRLTMDKFDLYGVAWNGGTYAEGVLYKLSKSGKFKLLHSFAGGPADGCNPAGSVVLDKSGHVYGTTESCGSVYYDGTIWSASKKGDETRLHTFEGDGCNPLAGLTRDSSGPFYGVTYGCGGYGQFDGALYELSARGEVNLLHTFYGSGGANPIGEVLIGTQFILFGTTYDGGTYNAGTVWSSYVP